MNRPSIALHARHGFREVARGSSFAAITFTGGTGVLLQAGAGSGADDHPHDIDRGVDHEHDHDHDHEERQ